MVSFTVDLTAHTNDVQIPHQVVGSDDSLFIYLLFYITSCTFASVILWQVIRRVEDNRENLKVAIIQLCNELQVWNFTMLQLTQK